MKNMVFLSIVGALVFGAGCASTVQPAGIGASRSTGVNYDIKSVRSALAAQAAAVQTIQVAYATKYLFERPHPDLPGWQTKKIEWACSGEKQRLTKSYLGHTLVWAYDGSVSRGMQTAEGKPEDVLARIERGKAPALTPDNPFLPVTGAMLQIFGESLPDRLVMDVVSLERADDKTVMIRGFIPDGRVTYEVWLDESNAFMPIKHRLCFQDAVGSIHTTRLSDFRPVHGLPFRYPFQTEVAVTYNHPEVAAPRRERTGYGTMTRLSVNEPLPDQLFSMEFPPGTRVDDRRAGNDDRPDQVSDGQDREPNQAIDSDKK